MRLMLTFATHMYSASVTTSSGHRKLWTLGPTIAWPNPVTSANTSRPVTTSMATKYAATHTMEQIAHSDGEYVALLSKFLSGGKIVWGLKKEAVLC